MPILHYHEPNLISFRNKAERSPFHLLTSLNGPGLLTSWRFPPPAHSPNSEPQVSTFSVPEEKHVHNLLGLVLESLRTVKKIPSLLCSIIPPRKALF